ncbi:UDP-N-acetylmuramate dehydrogenase [Candidatus Bipolaricaulota bacterium]
MNWQGILREIDLADHTSLRVGGPARHFSQPGGLPELERTIRIAEEQGLPVVVLGGGSNVVFSDSGYSGLVIHTIQLRGERFEGTRITAAAGERLSALAWRACRAGLSGLEWACGIPGTIGGAVVMNAGTRDGEIADSLQRVVVLGSGDRRELTLAELDLGYRTSAILTGALRGVVVEAEFELMAADPQRCIEMARQQLAARLERLPIGASAGSIFRNPITGPTAGVLLDRAGCKGMSVGDVRVSNQHANIIVNDGRENASDVLRLIELMKTRVRGAFGIDLEEEVVILGGEPRGT